MDGPALAHHARRLTTLPADRVGIVGLGVMGGAIARNLLRAGVAVIGHDIDGARADAFAAAGGRRASSAREVAEHAEIVLLLLPSSAALDAVTEGQDGLARGVRAGTTVIEMSTLRLLDKEALRARLEPHGAAVLDCPISGTGVQAERGDIIVYASGTEAAIERSRRVLALISREVINVGPFGSGSRLKYIANHLVAIHIAAAGEALALARNAGVDPAFAIRVLSAGAGTSRMLEIRGPMMATRAYSPPSMTIRLFQKDLRIIAEFAESCGVPVPLFAAASQLFAEALDEAFGELDTASVHEASLRAATSPAPRTPT